MRKRLWRTLFSLGLLATMTPLVSGCGTRFFEDLSQALENAADGTEDFGDAVDEFFDDLDDGDDLDDALDDLFDEISDD